MPSYVQTFPLSRVPVRIDTGPKRHIWVSCDVPFLVQGSVHAANTRFTFSGGRYIKAMLANPKINAEGTLTVRVGVRAPRGPRHDPALDDQLPSTELTDPTS